MASTHTRGARHARGTVSGPQSPGCRDDRGQAVLVAVILVSLVMTVVATTAYRTALDNQTNGGHAVAQGQAAQAAQAGLNAAYQRLHTMPLTTTCATPVTGSLTSAGTTLSYSVTAQYFRTTTATDTITCSSVSAGGEVQAVELTSTGTDLADPAHTMAMRSKATVSVASTSQIYSDSVFVDSNLTLSGADQFLGGTTHTMYIHGNLKCTGSAHVTETVVVTGNVTLSGRCSFSHNITAAGTIKVTTAVVGSSNKTPTLRLQHTALISTSTATPDITISPGSPVIGAIRARTTVSYPAWWTPPTPTETHTAALQTPPAQSMPTVQWTATGWKKLGYNVVTAGATCAKAYHAIFGTSLTTTASRAVYTSCHINLPATPSSDCPTYEQYYCTHVTLSRNLAIVTTGGFRMNGSSKIDASGTTTRDLSVIVPSGTTCTSNNNLTVSASGNVGSHVDTLFFTPCSMTISGAGNVSEGGIYAGSFAPVAGMAFGTQFPVAGLTGGTPDGGGTTTIDILYEILSYS
jgi:Tfp pilus assembly protein PilX